MQLHVRFFPDKLGTGHVTEKTEVFRDVAASVVFDVAEEEDTQQQPVFCFSLGHLSPGYREWEDCFLIVNLYSVSTFAPRQCLGEVVIQVKMTDIYLYISMNCRMTYICRYL